MEVNSAVKTHAVLSNIYQVKQLRFPLPERILLYRNDVSCFCMYGLNGFHHQLFLRITGFRTQKLTDTLTGYSPHLNNLVLIQAPDGLPRLKGLEIKRHQIGTLLFFLYYCNSFHTQFLSDSPLERGLRGVLSPLIKGVRGLFPLPFFGHKSSTVTPIASAMALRSRCDLISPLMVRYIATKNNPV